MIRETYKGRKIQIGKGKEWGYVNVKLNGTSLGDHPGTEAAALAWVTGWIDTIDSKPVDGDRWSAEWYAPGTFEICENGHPRGVDQSCEHFYCKERAA